MHHEHHDHHHPPTDQSVTNTAIAFGLNGVFAVIEFIFGGILNSTAILSDAVHDTGDAIAVGLSWFFQKYSRKKHDSTYTLGYKRFSLLGALITSVILIAGSIFVIIEAVPKLLHPTPVHKDGMLILGLIAVAVNIAGAYVLSRGTSRNESILSLHMLEDLLGWVAVIVVALVLKVTDWFWLDPLLSLLISGFIMTKAVPKFVGTLKILMEAVPESLDYQALVNELANVPNVRAVTQLNIWSIDGESHIGMVHILLEDEGKWVATKAATRAVLLKHHVDASAIEFDGSAEEHEHHALD